MLGCIRQVWDYILPKRIKTSSARLSFITFQLSQNSEREKLEMVSDELF